MPFWPTLDNTYSTNADGSYDAFPTVAADPTRTAGGGFTDDAYARYQAAMRESSSTPSLVQQMQAAGVNPSLYGALSFVNYAQPEMENVGPYDYSGGGDPLSGGIHKLTTANTNPVGTAFQSYLDRLKATDAERAGTAVQNQVDWNNMFLNSNIYNPGGANSYAIQQSANSGQASNIPLFTAPPVVPAGNYNKTPKDNARNTTVDTKVPITGTNPIPLDTKTPATNATGYTYNGAGSLSGTGNPQYAATPISSGNTLKGLYDASKMTNVGGTTQRSNRGTINFARALWRD